MMVKTTVFQSNRSQAVRLPKTVAFPGNVREVTIIRDGARRIIVPTNAIWDDFFEDDPVELGERNQPATQIREGF